MTRPPTAGDIAPDVLFEDSYSALSDRLLELAKDATYSTTLTSSPPPLASVGPINLRGLRIDLESAHWTDRHLEMRVKVPDRETGAPLPLVFDCGFEACSTDEQLAEALVKSIANVIAHEVAEMLFIRGQRFDPHKRVQFFEPGPMPPRVAPRSFQNLKFGFIFGEESKEAKGG